jgi:hypothetical protein
MKSLEDILKENFNCKKPFSKLAPQTMTKKGAKAYGKLIDLLDDVGNLTGQSVSMNRIVEELDKICNEI